ncbi:MAG: hypothetical protein ABFR97_07235 [Thermodesulfobacteriota bacterium]
MKDDIKFNGLPTLIGSIPLSDHQEAMAWIMEYTPAIPLWPQLPGKPQEGMLVQFMEGFPGLETDGDRLFFAADSERFQAEMVPFFEDFFSVTENPADLPHSRFGVSKERAQGLYTLAESCKESDLFAVKGQLTGPFTLLTGLTDQDKRAAFYDPTLRELVSKGTAMKAAWQVQFLKKIHENVILFMDEPALAGVGSSSLISISNEEIAADQAETINAIQQAGGLAGVHVCANTDWPLLLGLDYDIINFDAYGFFASFITCKSDILAFLERGGTIAWGIVPTAKEEDVEKESVASLEGLWHEQISQLASDDWPISRILAQSLITPSCGTGSLSPAAARKVLELTADLSARLREKFL